MYATRLPTSLIRKPGMRSRIVAVLLVLMATLGGGMMPSMVHAGPHQAAAFEQDCIHVNGTLSNTFSEHPHGMNCCGGRGALCAFHCTHIFLAPTMLFHSRTGVSMLATLFGSLSTQTYPTPPWHPPKVM